jgi:putative endonuclease
LIQVPCLPAGRDSDEGRLEDIMIFLYIIKSETVGELYVGICKDIENRVREHNKGKNRYTKGLRPWKIVHSEQFPDWQTAREKEKYYKSGSGKERLKEMLLNIQAS